MLNNSYCLLLLICYDENLQFCPDLGRGSLFFHPLFMIREIAECGDYLSFAQIELKFLILHLKLLYHLMDKNVMSKPGTEMINDCGWSSFPFVNLCLKAFMLEKQRWWKKEWRWTGTAPWKGSDGRQAGISLTQDVLNVSQLQPLQLHLTYNKEANKILAMSSN